MKNSPLRILSILVCLAIFTIAAFPQNKKSKVKKNVLPPLAQKTQPSKLEIAVFDEMNEARKNPKKYIGYLEERRKSMFGTIVKVPNQPDVRTIEGAAAIDEAVGDLKIVSNLDDFHLAEGLNAVARAHLSDLKENSGLGHFGKDGSDLKTRIGRFGTATGKCGENICYRGTSARDVVLIFLIDDGVKKRSHRKAVLSQNFKQAGVACGAGKSGESLCVVVFAETFKDKKEDHGSSEY